MTRPYRLGKRAVAASSTRQRLIEAATTLIVTSGFSAVTMDDVADRAGVSRPTVYRIFGSKVGLLEAVAWNALATSGLERVDAARNLPEPREALASFLIENCRMLDSAGAVLRAAVEAARHDPDLARVIDATYYGRRVESLRHLASRLADADMLRAGWVSDAVVDALMILTSVDTFEVLSQRRGLDWQHVAARLSQMATAFIADSSRQNSPS